MWKSKQQKLRNACNLGLDAQHKIQILKLLSLAFISQRLRIINVDISLIREKSLNLIKNAFCRLRTEAFSVLQKYLILIEWRANTFVLLVPVVEGAQKPLPQKKMIND